MGTDVLFAVQKNATVSDSLSEFVMKASKSESIPRDDLSRILSVTIGEIRGHSNPDRFPFAPGPVKRPRGLKSDSVTSSLRP